MRLLISFIIASSISSFSIGQSIGIYDLISICNKNNWEEVNNFLLNKGWEYYKSEKGNTFRYNTIIWSYNRSYSDEAEGWFYLFTYDGFPNKVYYQIFNMPAYNKIKNGLEIKGFKLTDSEILDNEIISVYSNAGFTISISTSKQENDYSRSITAYAFTLIKKSGIYDVDNGNKVDYWFGSESIKTEYNLVNGKLHGTYRSYSYDGTLLLEGYYVNGKQNGNFKEYSSNGNLTMEYTMKNGIYHGPFIGYHNNGVIKKKGAFLNGEHNGYVEEFNENGDKEADYNVRNGEMNGTLRIYKNNKIYEEKTIINDSILNGPYTNYFYDENQDLLAKISGKFLMNEKDDTWKTFIVHKGKEHLINIINYKAGVKNGKFQEAVGDSLIIGQYYDGELDGKYTVHLDVAHMIIGGAIRTDTSELILITEGYYNSGEKSGVWRYFDIAGQIIQTGAYINGLKNGEWKFYYPKYVDVKGKLVHYSGELYRISMYHNDKLNGKTIKYSYLDEIKYPCDSIEHQKTKTWPDTCLKKRYIPVFEITHYKDDYIDGPYELRDSTDKLMVKGNYIYDKKEGEWLYQLQDTNTNPHIIFFQKGNFVKGKKNGKWIEYYDERTPWVTMNFENDQLHGEYIVWRDYQKYDKVCKYFKGRVTEILDYDSIGVNPTNKYEIFYDDHLMSSYTRTQYSDFDGTVSSIKIPEDLYIIQIPINNIKYVSQTYKLFKGLNNEDIANINNLVFRLLIQTNLYEQNTTGAFLLESKGPHMLKIEGHRDESKKIGKWRYHFTDQNVILVINNSDTQDTEKYYAANTNEPYTGELVFKHWDDGIKEVRKIKDGLRNGKTIFYDSNGSVIKKENYKNGILK